MGLAKNPISQFSQLVDQILAHITTSKAYRKTNASLINIRQAKDKSLKSYLIRFNQATLEFEDLSSTVVMHSILASLESGDFSKSLAKRLVETMTKLLARSANFINIEEVKLAKQQAN